MKLVFILLDSLNRNALQSYSKDSNIQTPNLKRFEEKCITFDNHYVGSLPCLLCFVYVFGALFNPI